MREGTTKSRAPSGVDLINTGVSTSIKPRLSAQPRLLGHLVPQLEVLTNRSTTQVRVTILHAEVIAAIGIFFNGKRGVLDSR